MNAFSPLQRSLAQAVRNASVDAQLGLIRAHPELAGKAMVAKTLTAESTHEQGKAGLTECTPDEFARIQKLNADYNAKFGFPFILAVRGPRGAGLTKQQIIDATLAVARRVDAVNPRDRAEQLSMTQELRDLHTQLRAQIDQS